MKKFLSLSLVFVFIICLCGCGGNFSQVNLNEPMAIPENGTVEKSLLEKIRDENAIAVFEGEADGFKYEWTVFGSDVTDAKDVNLTVALSETDDSLNVKLTQTEELGFPALLSIHLNDKWSAQSATAYKEGAAVYSVSVTGSKTSILNISVNKIESEFSILPDNTEVTQASPENAEQETNGTEQNGVSVKEDDYLSDTKQEDNRVYSDGKVTIKDKYETDPVPVGKPMPVEPENQEIDTKKSYSCTFSIECSTILNNLSDLDPDKLELVPVNGVILAPTKVIFYEGESVYDVLQRICKENGIHMEASWTPVYNSAYIEGINNLYEFDCGALSGWMYAVDGWYPNYGCSRYQLKDGEKVEWRYTCDLGRDVGCDWLAGTE